MHKGFCQIFAIARYRLFQARGRYTDMLSCNLSVLVIVVVLPGSSVATREGPEVGPTQASYRIENILTLRGSIIVEFHHVPDILNRVPLGV